MPPEQAGPVEQLRRRHAAEGDVFRIDAATTAILDPDLATAVNCANFAEQDVADPLGDLLAGRRGPAPWQRVRAAWQPVLRQLSGPDTVAALYRRMVDLAAERAGREVDLTAFAHEVCTYALLPVVVAGLGPRGLARLRRDVRIGFTELSAVPAAPGRAARLRTTWAEVATGLTVRAELRARAAGRRPRRPDLADPLVDLLPDLGYGRAVDAVTALLTAIAGPPGAVAACLLLALRQHPQWADRIGAELARLEPGALHRPGAAPLTHRFVKEALRMWSPPLLLLRPVRVPVTVDGLSLAVGERYLVSPYLMHHDARRWERPDEFDPDRWLPGSGAGAGAFVPFGLAPKSCVGAGLGLVQLLAFCRLATTDLRIEPAPGPPPPVALRAVAVPTTLRGTITLTP
ncbi:cytochrome P450 [Catellatospora sp. TT07R-123]|uniref:cytochrome P450 n=1 Tax=Catellatospora sp. TT07R-123 TaxID=2733863 RepID=UPI001B1F12B5|nr:cytochrome P450 [Catellatospora sp. TT07R-123]GHJ44482.1 cytochrome P450 [Catellatospora sp. TT07R-123]